MYLIFFIENYYFFRMAAAKWLQAPTVPSDGSNTASSTTASWLTDWLRASCRTARWLRGWETARLRCSLSRGRLFRPLIPCSTENAAARPRIGSLRLVFLFFIIIIVIIMIIALSSVIIIIKKLFFPFVFAIMFYSTINII